MYQVNIILKIFKNVILFSLFFALSVVKRKNDEDIGRASSSKSSSIVKKSRKCEDSSERTPATTFDEFKPFGFFLTKVTGIPNQYNETGALSLKGEMFCHKKKFMSCFFVYFM